MEELVMTFVQAIWLGSEQHQGGGREANGVAHIRIQKP